jgi:hypothetical protein
MMVLLTLVAIAMLSLSTIEQRSSGGSSNEADRMARANARMALMIALGELQKAAGPDQRVSANADILAGSNQPHLLGVWKSYKQANSDATAIDYTRKTKDLEDGGDFVQWLSSASKTDQMDYTYHSREPSNSIKLVSDGTVSDTTGHIEAPLIEVNMSSSGGGTGKYAWQVFDESQKINLALNNNTPATDAERIAQLGTAGKPGFQIDVEYDELKNLSDSERQKLITLNSSALVGYDSVANDSFHHLTTNSNSLLVDVSDGGFQKDLSLLFDDASLPAAYASRHIYSEDSTPLVPAPTRFVNAEPMPSPDPKWSILHSHYALYKEVSKSNDAYGISASNVERSTTSPEYFDQQQILPVVSNAQFIFSMAPQKHPGMWDSTDPNMPYMGFFGFWVDFAVTLWNPYNVEMRFDAMELAFYRFPLQVEFFRNDANSYRDVPGVGRRFYGAANRIEPRNNGIGGHVWISASNGNPVHIAYMFNQGNNNNVVSNTGDPDIDDYIQDKLPYRVRLTGANATPGVEDIVLKPGEYKVFAGPQSTLYHHENWNYTRGHIVKEGFSPYNTANNQGGIFERYISTNENYQSQCTFTNGNYNSQQIRIKFGDRYRVEVSPAKVNRATSFAETNDREIVAYMKFYRGDGGSPHGTISDPKTIDKYEAKMDLTRKLVGVVEIDLPVGELENSLPSYGMTEMPEMEVREDNSAFQGPSLHKIPYLIASLRLKTEQDSDTDGNAGAMWLHNGVSNPYFTTGIPDSDGNPVDQNEHPRSHQYEIVWEPMTSWNNIPTVEVDNLNRGYGATGVSSQNGVHYAPFNQIPLMPATSMVQFSHAPLNVGGQAPLTTQIVGNSFASPLIPLEKKSATGTLGPHLDHSYMANNILFDGYFLSTATTEQGAVYGTATRSLDAVTNDFFDAVTPLANPNIIAASTPSGAITSADYDTFAQYLYNKGAFNVNSTSVKAWALFLASGTQESLPILNVLTASQILTDTSVQDSGGAAVSRFAPMVGDEVDASINDQTRWQGHRRLTNDQIWDDNDTPDDPTDDSGLAVKIVDQVKTRGPFQSIAEFVNRRLESSGASASSGALQSAIDASDLNEDFGVAAPKYDTELDLDPASQTANTSDGAATFITQADLLNRLAPSITVRGDTFRIRAYGEATIGAQTAVVWCEAVVQRGHELADNTQLPTTAYADQNTTNQTYGRRFKIASFRWLSEEEI